MKIAFSLISFLFASGGFLYSAFHLYRKSVPLYFKLLVSSSGCLAFERLSVLVNYLTDGYYYVTLGELGVFASLLFILSAEYGALDHLVDDGVQTRKYRLISLCAPLVSLSALAFIFFCARTLGYLVASVIVFILIPSVPASYYTLKHFILRPDALGFLKVTKVVNACVLLFYLFLYASVVALLYNSVLGNVCAAMTALLSALVSIFAVKGEKQWIRLI